MTESSKKKLTKLDDLYKIIAMIVLIFPSLIVFSIMYNFGYFYYFNIALYQLPIVWNDFILSAVSIIPPLVLVCFCGLLININKKNEKAKNHLSDENCCIKNIEVFLFFLLVIFIVLNLRLFSYQCTLVAISLLPIFIKNHNKKYINMMFVFGGLLLITFFFGYDSAYSSYKKSNLMVEFFSNENGSKYLIRTFEKFIVVKNYKNELEFIRIEKVKKIKSSQKFKIN